MAKIGEGLWFDLDLDDSKFKTKIEDVKKQVENLSKKVDINFNIKSIEKDMKAALANSTKNVKVKFDRDSVAESMNDVLTKGAKKTLAKIGVDEDYLIGSVRTALKGQIFNITISAKGDMTSGSVTEVNNTAKELNKTLDKQGDIVDGLRDKMLALFSVDMVKRFLTQVIEVGGEIEKQKLALGSIIGDTALAGKLYGQISNLSMISPFDVEDIMKYTKQLSAFGIKYNELYDTTKMLADIAAGVGVDFGRIAYEYGQTSSRGWLDARELRMFANSGIPLLQKLADYYSRLNKERVSAAEVREKITKREVSFEDVRTVLQEMTSEGGEFYRMQEVMAESLAAKWRNLGNAWNLMLADMAESGALSKTLKVTAEILTALTKNYTVLAPAIGAATLSAVAWRITLAAVRSDMVKTDMVALSSMNTWSKMGVILRSIGASVGSIFKAMAKNPLTWIVLAVGSIGGLYNKIKDADQKIKDIAKNTKETAVQGQKNLREDVERYQPTATGLNTSQMKASIRELKEELKKYDPVWEDTFSKIFAKTNNEKDFVNNLNTQYEKLVTRLHEVKGAYEDLEDINTLGTLMDQATKHDSWYKYLNPANYFNGSLMSYSELATKSEELYNKAVTEFDQMMSKSLKGAEAEFDFLISKMDEMPSLKEDKGWENLKTTMAETSSYADKLKVLLKYIAENDFTQELVYQGTDLSNYIANFDKTRKQMLQRAPEMYNALLNMLGDKESVKKTLAETGQTIDEYIKNLPEEKRIPIYAVWEGIISKSGVSNKDLKDAIAKDVLVDQAGWNILNGFIDTNDKPDPLKGGGNGNGDKALEELKKRYAQYKSIWDDFKLLSERFGSEEAWGRVQQMPIWERLFGSKKMNQDEFLKIAQTYQDEIDELLKKSNDFNREGRNAFWATIFRDILSRDNEQIKPAIQDALASVEEALSNIKENYDLNHKIFDITGARESAMVYSDEIAKLIRPMLKNADIDLSTLIGKSKDELKTFVKDPKYNDAIATAVKALKNALKQEAQEIHNEYTKMLSEAQHFQQRRNGIEDDYNRRILASSDETQRKILENLKQWKMRQLNEGLFGDMIDFMGKGGLDRRMRTWADATYRERSRFMESDAYAKMSKKEQDQYAEQTKKLADMMGGVAVSFADLKRESDKYKETVKDAIAAQEKYASYINQKSLAFLDMQMAKNVFGENSSQYANAKAKYDKITVEADIASVEADTAMQNANAAANTLSNDYSSTIGKIQDVGNTVQGMGSSVSGMYSGITKLVGVSSVGFAGIIGAIISIVEQIVSVAANNGEKIQTMFDNFGDNLNNVLKQGIIGTDEQWKAMFGSFEGIGHLFGGLVDGILNSLTFGFWDKWIGNGVSDKNYEKDMERLTSVNSALIYAVQELTTVMSNQTNQEAVKTYEKIMRNLTEKELALQEQMIRSGAIYSNGIMGFGGSHSSNYRIDGNVTSDEWRKVSSIVGKSIKSASDFWNLTSEEMWNVATYGESIYAKIKQYADDGYGDVAQYMDDYIEIWKEAEEAFEHYFEAMTGLNYSEVYDNFVSMIQDMDTTTADFANQFEEYLFNAIVNAMSTETIKPLMGEWQRQFALAMEDGSVDANEYAELKRRWDEMVQKGKDIRDVASDITGYDGENGSSGLSASIKGITADQADILAALLQGVRGDTSVQRAVLEQVGYIELPKLNAIAESQLAQLTSIADNTRISAEYAEICAGYAEQTYDLFYAVTEGNRKVSVQ